MQDLATNKTSIGDKINIAIAINIGAIDQMVNLLNRHLRIVVLDPVVHVIRRDRDFALFGIRTPFGNEFGLGGVGIFQVDLNRSLVCRKKKLKLTMSNQKSEPIDNGSIVGDGALAHAGEVHVQVARGLADRGQDLDELLGRDLAIAIGVKQLIRLVIRHRAMAWLDKGAQRNATTQAKCASTQNIHFFLD